MESKETDKAKSKSATLRKLAGVLLVEGAIALILLLPLIAIMKIFYRGVQP